MHLVCVGISHKTAPLELRERLALDDEQATAFGRRLVEEPPVAEAVALSTCNRTELYLFADDTLAAEQVALRHLSEHAAVELGELRPSVYSHSGDAAIGHLFRVASSLDSMVVGEDQILAQIKNAYGLACGSGCTSTVFNKLFRHALEVGKRVRTDTSIGARPVSVSSAAVELAKQVLGKLEHRVVLVLGAGETSELTLTHLRAAGADRMLVASRTLETAQDLAGRCGGRAEPFERLDDLLVEADIVISSTAAGDFIVTRKQVERALRKRRGRPVFMIDIAVPRDLDPEINRIDNAFLYDIDGLQDVVERNRAERQREAERAEAIVDAELARMNEWLAGLEVVPTIALLRGAVDGIREAELQRLGARLEDLTPEQRNHVEALTAAIVNKILHMPTVRMKEVAQQRDAYVYVDVLRHLFGLNGAAGEAAPACDLGVDVGDRVAGTDPGASTGPAAGSGETPASAGEGGT